MSRMIETNARCARCLMGLLAVLALQFCATFGFADEPAASPVPPTPPAEAASPAASTASPSANAKPSPPPPRQAEPASQKEPVPAAPPQTAALSGTSPILAQRGDLTLTAADVTALLAHIEAGARARLLASPQALADFLRRYLRDQTLLEQARAAHWDDNPGVAYAAERARQQVIIDSWLQSRTQPDPAYPSEAEISAAYEANKTRLATPREFHLAQIFIAVPPDAPKAADAAARIRISGLRDMIERQHKDFAAVAAQASQDSASAAAGGDLGWVREPQLQPSIREAIAGLADGAVSPPIRGPNGWHLIRVIETRPAVLPSLAQLHDQLAAALREQRQKALAQQFLEAMDKAAPTRVDEIEAGKLAAP